MTPIRAFATNTFQGRGEVSDRRPPRILWIRDRELEKGGVACALYDLYPSLVRAGADIVFAAPRNATFPRLEGAGARVYKILPTYPRARGYLWSLIASLAILRLVTRLRPTIVVADHTNGLWLLLFLKGIRCPIKAIYRNHGGEFLSAHRYLARLVLRAIDHIVTVSQPEVDALRRLTNSPVSLVPNCLPAHCLNPGRVRNARMPPAPRIAYVGWLNREKGIYAFTNLIAEIRKVLPGTKGVAIGQIRLRPGLEDSRDDLLACMNAAGIQHLGEVAREEIFREVDFLLVCSRRESFGLTMVEAPFFDVVPISYDSPGPRFLLGGVAECLVENGKGEQAKETVLRLWRSPHRRSEICERLRADFSRQFDPDLVAARLMAAFDS